MSKRVFYLVVLTLILTAVLFGCTENASSDQSDEYEFINIAGTYTLREEIRNGNLLIYDMQYEFFLNGKIICRTYGYDSSSRELADVVSNGKYVCDRKSGDIAFQFTTATKPSLMHYYGKYVETNVAKFYLTGANSDGELAGDIVTASYEAEGPGRVSGYYYQYVNKGGDASTVIATPGLGAKFVEWSDGVTTPTRTDTNLTENLSVKAVFVQETPVYTVKYIVNDEFGEIVGKTTQYVLSGGSTESVTVECKYPYGINDNYGYTFVGWSDGVTSAQRSDSNVTKDMEITAIIKRVWTVEYYGIDDHLIEKQYVIDGEDGAPVTAESEYTQHYFVGWNDGVTTLTRQEKNVKSNIKVDAEYAPKLEIRYAQGDNYQYVIPGQDATPVTAVPASWPENMYEFDCWSDGVTTATRHDKNITEEFIVYAKFRMKLAEYTITYTAGKNGRIDGETTQTVKKWENAQSVTAVPDDGYEFDCWSDGVTTATRQDTNICEEFTVTAIFKKILPKYTLTYTTNLHGRIDGEVTQTVRQGENGQSVTAVPDDGYEFAGWSDGVTTATRQDLSVQADMSVTARFIEKLPENTEDFSGGAGIVGNPYKITTIEQLKNIEKFNTSAFILLNDIELPIAETGTSNFKPLFDDVNQFNGIFDGNGKTISNITMINEETFFTGLFAYIGSDGIVKNLKLSNMNVSGTNYIGGLCGYNLGSITNCEVSVNISYIKSNDYKVYVGGIAGRSAGCVDNNISSGTITVENTSNETYIGGLTGFFEGNSVANASSSSIINVSSSSDSLQSYVGGLIGYSGNDVTMIECHATGNVNATGSSYSYAGGLIGYFRSSVTITECYVTGNVTSTSYAGGLVGFANLLDTYITIINCYATGNITSTNNSAGGLIGYVSNNGRIRITDCHTTCNVTSNSSSAGGLIGNVDVRSVFIDNSYATGNVNGGYAVGGLIGHWDSWSVSTITYCYATGNVIATANSGSNSYAGGLVGYCDNEAQIKNSFSLSVIKGNNKIGAIVGQAGSTSITNVHWLVNEESEAEFAVGYDENLGIPTNTGTVKHTDVSDFYTLADTLNEGSEEAVWENKDEVSLPTLIKKEKNKLK